jgi:type II secretory pathway component PulF
MKGIAVETVLYAVILVLALILITITVMKLIPAFGKFINATLAGIKRTLCDMLPWLIRWLC